MWNSTMSILWPVKQFVKPFQDSSTSSFSVWTKQSKARCISCCYFVTHLSDVHWISFLLLFAFNITMVKTNWNYSAGNINFLEMTLYHILLCQSQHFSHSVRFYTFAVHKGFWTFGLRVQILLEDFIFVINFDWMLVESNLPGVHVEALSRGL